MKLKLDLHPIFNDGRRIEDALRDILDEAIRVRATEVEIIPGKGSGALKKTVLRFLDQPEQKARYHRVEKDGDNWGRLFVHFRHDRSGTSGRETAPSPTISLPCACCEGLSTVPEPEESPAVLRFTCGGCESPNRATVRRGRDGLWRGPIDLDYDA